ncbi:MULTISPECIES: tetrahydromethanopterin S-methyltransferase subunit H [Methanothermobacter]|jgi:tetrahydromethanopterin S-methyltransferase subunit H|uniref:Tetrahydromethanopterin S-methyltransferase subunit H n=3 Tax=Methanothermobacter TaxID=145260 RepID=MTRH_METTH|nr:MULTISPECIES: tetrahydromethanopterin S-methyltransferase subunit H [Methanothermobacter]O27224.1 RecName: Full=Tetrahydromethanopterin S-methyltransferase subunit H; AltName: Full=N5-methyltetrahydromethanopterin--coenzyme M methyltransferase subunit H [Methanothermobacter thermautotrophicus str. Delta H]MDK2875344.1 tetrahydromethanopterin S-methyltransferase subunit [Methanothermobacter sp.]AAB85645.1 N5-methyl-tetrahydromethanopterin:coenzyme M methyltransferase, subunit H [Methanothermob
MFRFDKEQIVLDIAGTKIGGQPGEYPTVLAGTIFYGGHSIIEDEKAGVFDKDKAEALIKTQEEMSDVTGNPHIVQTFGQTPEAIVKYLEFVGDVTDAPFFIDSTSGEARIAGANYASEVGLEDRAIYNSVNMAADEAELEALKETKLSASIVLGFNPMDPTVDGKIGIWEDGAGTIDKGLLEMAAECGIDKYLMDVAVTPLGQGAGVAVRTSFAVKSKWGYPVGSGIHNVPSAWDWLREYKKDHKEAWPVCDVGSNLIQQMAGGDFVLYGPIENAKMAFPACAMADIFISEAAKDIGTEPVEDHPFFKLL